MSRLVNNGFVALVALVAAGCAHTLGEIPLADGNILVIEGYGTKSSVQLSCLGSGAVEQLIGTQIPDNVAKQSCYQVAVASSNSSDISKAVSAFVSADTEFGKMLQTGKPPSRDDKSLDVRRKASPEEKIAYGIIAAAGTVDDDGVFDEMLKGSRAQVGAPDKALSVLEDALNNAKSESVRNRLERAVAAFKS